MEETPYQVTEKGKQRIEQMRREHHCPDCSGHANVALTTGEQTETCGCPNEACQDGHLCGNLIYCSICGYAIALHGENYIAEIHETDSHPTETEARAAYGDR